MNEERLIFAIGEIEDSYIRSAGNRLSGKSRSHKALVCIAAVIALLLTTFATAMAVSEDFRDSVLSILRIGDTEQVRHSGTVDIGDVNASYMELNSGFMLRNGLLYKTGDDVFCLFGNGELTELETFIRTAELRHNGVTLTLRYAYTVIDGQLHVVELSQDGMDKDTLMYLWSLTPLRGSEDKAWLLTLNESGGDYSAYPLLFDVRSGEMTDILQGIDLGGIICDAWLFSPDNRYAVIRTNGNDRLVDVESRSVTELFGCHESYFLSDGSLLCFESCGGGFDLVRRDPGSGAETIILRNAHFAGSASDKSGYLSVDYNGGSGDHALYIDENGGITLLDLRDGSRLVLDGITQAPEEKLYTLESADGDRIMVAVSIPGYGERARGVFRSLGIIDCESGTLKLLDRSNSLDNCGEELLGFMPNGSIGLIGMSESGQWLYVYDFSGP